MKTKSNSRRAFFSWRISVPVGLFLGAVFLALFATAKPQVLTDGHAHHLDAQMRAANQASVAPSGAVQEAWVARYNGPGNAVDEAKAIAVDPSGNVYVTGRSNGGPSADFDYATVKYDSAGQEQWVARYNGPENGDDHAAAIAVDASGNVYVTGRSSTSYATIKYSSAGEERWVARYPGFGDSGATALALDGQGNIYVTGYSAGPNGSWDYTTIKYDPGGQQQWVARYAGPATVGIDYPAAIAVDSSRNVYVTGESQGSASGYDYATVKYDSAGQQQWVARYNGPGNATDAAFAITFDALGDVYVTGFSYGSGSGYDYATIKYDSAGQEQWVARYNGPGNNIDEAVAIAIDGLGNVYVTGTSQGTSTSDDYATIKYNSSGQQQWAARYNGPANHLDEAYAIAADGSGNTYVTGSSEGNADDYATIKYDSSGQQQWVVRYDGPANSFDDAKAIAIDNSGSVYVTGESAFDYATIKYVQAITPTPTPTATPTPTPTATPCTGRCAPTPRPRPTAAPRP